MKIVARKSVVRVSLTNAEVAALDELLNIIQRDRFDNPLSWGIREKRQFKLYRELKGLTEGRSGAAFRNIENGAEPFWVSPNADDEVRLSDEYRSAAKAARGNYTRTTLPL